MDFDPTTAILVEEDQFDPLSASFHPEDQIKRDMIDKLVGMTPQEMNERGHWVAGGLQQTAKDVLTIPTHFFNQMAGNVPRMVSNVSGESLPTEAQSGVANTLNKMAGVVGGAMGLPAKMAVNATNLGSRIAPKVILPASKALSGTLGQRMATGALTGMVGGATYAPTEPSMENYRNQVMLSTALGAVFPEVTRGVVGKIKKYGMTAKEKYNEVINKNADVYRKLVKVNKGDIKQVEMVGKKDLNDSFRLMAEERLPLKRTAENKLDVTDALEQIQQRKQTLHQELNNALKSNRRKQFSLAEIGYKAKEELKKSFKNDTEYKKAEQQLFKYIGDAIEERGNKLTGQQLNDFKQGMWSVGYDGLRPTSQKVARIIGNVAKKSIEKGYPKGTIQEVNSKLGQFLTVESLLKNSHGGVILHGKAGGGVARLIGAGAGALAGTQTGIPISPVIGAFYGQQAGAKIQHLLSDPARILGRLPNPKNIKPAVGHALIRKAVDKGGEILTRRLSPVN